MSAGVGDAVQLTPPMVHSLVRLAVSRLADVGARVDASPAEALVARGLAVRETARRWRVTDRGFQFALTKHREEVGGELERAVKRAAASVERDRHRLLLTAERCGKLSRTRVAWVGLQRETREMVAKVMDEVEA